MRWPVPMMVRTLSFSSVFWAAALSGLLAMAAVLPGGWLGSVLKWLTNWGFRGAQASSIWLMASAMRVRERGKAVMVADNFSLQSIGSAVKGKDIKNQGNLRVCTGATEYRPALRLGGRWVRGYGLGDWLLGGARCTDREGVRACGLRGTGGLRRHPCIALREVDFVYW